MKTRLTVAFLILFLIGACSSDDPPTAPPSGGTGSTGGDNPTLTGISPPGAGIGIEVKIIGTDFGTAQETGGVKVAGVDAAIESWSATEVEFIVPAGIPSDSMAGIVLTTLAGKTVSSEIDIPPPNVYRVTTDIALDQYPCWGPGGNYIFFCSTRSGGANWDLYRIPATGGETQRLTNYDGPDFYPDVKQSSGEVAWSSTQDHLGYNMDGDYEIFDGYLVAVQGGFVTQGIRTQNESRDLDPAWNNSAYGGYDMASTWELVDENGNFVAWKVVLHENVGTRELTEGRQPSFSDNGRWLVYNFQENIFKIEIDVGPPVQLTDTGMDYYPHWGQVNDKIVFQRGGAGDIMVMNSDGTDLQELVATRNNEYTPSWSRDCTKVVYCAHRWSNFDIYVYVVP